jgi:Tol biopolymer transport system component
MEDEAGGAQIAVARNGTVVYARGESARASVFVWVDQNAGRIDTLPLPRGEYGGFDLSPDGRQVAVVLRSATGREELWVMDAAGGARARVLTEGIPIGSPRWWPGGGSLMYQAVPKDGNMNYGMRAVFRQSIRDPADREALPRNGLEPSPDGEQVVTADSGGLSLTPRNHPGRRVRLAAAVTPFFTSFSPDGRWLAYTDVDDPTDQSEVYVTLIGRPADRYKVSVSGGEEPVWTPDGRALIYRNGQQWWAADLSMTGELRVSRTRRLFEGPFLNVPGVSHDVSPDSRRQLVLLGPWAETTNQLVLVTNWFTEVERLTRRGR